MKPQSPLPDSPDALDSSVETPVETAAEIPENPFEAQLQQSQPLQNAALPEILPAIAPRRRRALRPFLLVLLPILGASGWLYKQRRDADALYRLNRAAIVLPERMARVPAAWSAATLATRLEKSRKIRDEDAFREAAAQVGLQSVTPGSYFLPPRATPLELARAFKAGPTHIDITFPEGFTARQFAARLRKNGVAGAEKLAKVPASQLEGRLFPSTYEVPLQSDEKSLVRLFESKWQREMAKLPRPFPKIGGKEMTPQQVVILASLVEREAASSAEMPLVAGALVGRLRRPMRLQVDASIQYARLLANENYKNRLFFEDLEIDSPYNTYRNDGLPPTPICNPGAAALRAAARPAPTGALFYVYSPRSKKHLFAPDFETHKRYIAQVRRERDEINAEKAGD